MLLAMLPTITQLYITSNDNLIPIYISYIVYSNAC